MFHTLILSSCDSLLPATIITPNKWYNIIEMKIGKITVSDMLKMKWNEKKKKLLKLNFQPGMCDGWFLRFNGFTAQSKLFIRVPGPTNGCIYRWFSVKSTHAMKIIALENITVSHLDCARFPIKSNRFKLNNTFSTKSSLSKLAWIVK